jgi:hypothetical protein
VRLRGPFHRETGVCIETMCRARLLNQDISVDTLVLLNKTLEIFVYAEGVDASNVAVAAKNLGVYFELMGDYESARPYYTEAHRIYTAQHGASFSKTVETAEALKRVRNAPSPPPGHLPGPYPEALHVIAGYNAGAVLAAAKRKNN